MCECIKLTNEALAKQNMYLDTVHWFSQETGAYRTTVRIGTVLIEKKRGQRPSTMVVDVESLCTGMDEGQTRAYVDGLVRVRRMRAALEAASGGGAGA